VLSALVRAHFCELLAPKIPHGDSDLFFLGLLSMMESILETPIAKILENVPVDQETKAVLMGCRQPLATTVPVDAGARIWGVGDHGGAGEAIEFKRQRSSGSLLEGHAVGEGSKFGMTWRFQCANNFLVCMIV
jgi:hypothetical protein